MTSRMRVEARWSNCGTVCFSWWRNMEKKYCGSRVGSLVGSRDNEKAGIG